MQVTTFVYLYEEVCINQLKARTRNLCGFRVQSVIPS
jgi:hypothetical protein